MCYVHVSSLKNWNMQYLIVISFIVFNSKFYYYIIDATGVPDHFH
jgi:hypothetical protein